MDTFVSLFLEYLPALAAALVLGAAVCFAASALLRRLGRALPRSRKLWLFVTASYFFTLLFLLVLRTPYFSLGGSGGQLNLRLFLCYREAAANFEAIDLANILMNILIFVPFGALFTPLFGESRLRWLVIPLGALVSLLAETMQYLSGVGMADVDDLFNNTLGVVCGFAIARLWTNARGGHRERAAAALLTALVCVAPPFVSWAVSANSLYGELYPFLPDGYRGAPAGEVSFSEEAERFLASGGTLPVYRTSGCTAEEALESARRFLDELGVEPGAERVYDGGIYIDSADGQYSFQCSFTGPEYVLSRITTGFSSIETPDLGESEVRSCAAAWGVIIPGGAVMSSVGSSYVFAASSADGLGGEVRVDFFDGEVGEIYVWLYALTETASARMLTADECLEKLARGDYYGALETGDEVSNAETAYLLDSKGVYRPVLRLQGSHSAELALPAVG